MRSRLIFDEGVCQAKGLLCSVVLPLDPVPFYPVAWEQRLPHIFSE